jgi:ABC-type sugar transport system ATPase subunit
MADIRLERVSRSFGPVVAVDSVDLEVEDREFLVLLGPSGCGKSTVLRLIAGLERPSAGAVSIGGRDVTHVRPKDRDLAMVFQSYALYPHMSVFDNIAFGIRQRGLSGHDLKESVRLTAARLGIDSLLDRRPAQLSGGQRQRVALARAIVRKPQAFLMDEPLSNLDAKLRVQTRRELARLHEDLQTTTVFVTHDQVEAMTLGQRVAIIASGRLQQVGRPQDVYDRPANLFVAGFIGSPPMNILPLDRTPEGFQAGGGKIHLDTSLAPAAAPETLALGVRPEALRIGIPEAPGALSFLAPVQVVEHLGSQVNLECAAGGVAVTAVAQGHVRAVPGQSIPLWCGREDLHFFDGHTGERLP